MKNERSALILWGGWEGHQPGQCAEIVQGMLVEDGFQVTKENDLQILVKSDPGKFALIVPIISMGSITEEQGKALTSAVEAGTGITRFQCGFVHCFRTYTYD